MSLPRIIFAATYIIGVILITTGEAEGKSDRREHGIHFCEKIANFDEETACKAKNVYSEIDGPGIKSSFQKKAIAEEDYALWSDLTAPMLSPDGKWVIYTISASTGEQTLVARSTVDSVEYRVHRGSLGSQDYTEGSFLLRWKQYELRPTRVLADKYVVFSISKSSGDTRAVTDGIGVLSLANGEVLRIPNVASYVTPKNPESTLLAYTMKTEVDASKKAAGKQTDDNSAVLVIRELDTDVKKKIRNVVEFLFDDSGEYLAYVVESNDENANGVYIDRLADGRRFVLARGAGRYKNLIFGRKQQLAFISDSGSSRQSPAYSLYYASSPRHIAKPVVSAETLNDGVEISSNLKIRFANNSNAVIFGLNTGSKAKEDVASQSGGALEYELWNWQDPGQISGYPDMKWVPSDWQKSKPYLAVYSIDTERWTQLGSAENPMILWGGNTRYAVGINEEPYRLEGRHNGDYGIYDVNLIDTTSGISSEFRRKLQPSWIPKGHWGKSQMAHSSLGISPSGRYMVYFEEQRWWAVDLETKSVSDMTGGLLPAVRFDEDLKLYATRPIGVAGWAPGDRYVYIYDRRGIWRLDPAGLEAPIDLLAGVGDRQNMVFRRWEDYIGVLGVYPSGHYGLGSSGDSDPYISQSTALLLVGLDLDTMDSGIWQVRLDGAYPPEMLLMADKLITPIATSADGLKYLVSMESFSEYPDLWVGSDFSNLTKVSNVNPHQQGYRWGDSELVEFTSESGVSLKGRLYTPEKMDPSKKYPMVVSVYGVMSKALHMYSNPRPRATAPHAEENWPEIVSRGYIHFIPDVVSAYPYPGKSAVDAIVPAVNSIIERGFVDPKRIAITGFSYGGFETGFVITQTNLFRCAIASGLLSNAVSFYGDPKATFGQDYLEGGQFGFGGSLWENPEVYISNSPVMYADRVQTPILIMQNPRDNALPYSQGMEFFFALRRNKKKAWLISYRGEGHGLEDYENRVDWDRRVHQYLDYCLKDAPMPSWMQYRAQLR